LINSFVLGEDASQSGLKRSALSSSSPARTPVTSTDDDWEEF